MKIERVLFATGTSAFFFDDQRAIKGGATRDGFDYVGTPVTPEFSRIRMPGESISVLLLLDDGQIAVGDCAAVQYSGTGGRDRVFRAADHLSVLEKQVRPRLEGREVERFRTMAREMAEIRVDGSPLHTALRYGLTQALLDARAKARQRLRAEVVCEEYDLPVVIEPVPIFAQSGDNRHENVDKMILKRADALPHGLINNVDEKLGRDGGKLREYVRWIARRIERLRDSADYRPAIHVDVYGTLGLIFENDPRCVANFMARLEADAAPFSLYIEGPVDLEDKSRQIDSLRRIRERLDRSGSSVKIVADEWCNTREDIIAFCDAQACHMVQIKTPDLGGIDETVESVLYCRRHGMEAYQGGTCNETDLSARCCVHLAMATRPERMLAKPGMGFDEGFTVVRNEMARILAVLAARTNEGAGHAS